MSRASSPVCRFWAGRRLLFRPRSGCRPFRRKLIGARHASGFGGNYELKTISTFSVEEENEEEEAEDSTVPPRKVKKKERVG